jgi:hypothetical protein
VAAAVDMGYRQGGYRGSDGGTPHSVEVVLPHFVLDKGCFINQVYLYRNCYPMLFMVKINMWQQRMQRMLGSKLVDLT